MNEHIRRLFYRTFIIGSALLCATGVAAWTGPTQSPPNGNVTWSLWQQNGSIANYTSGNVGIGTTSPGSLLSVQGNGYFTGNVKAGSVDSSQASYVSMMLAACSGGCGSYHTLNAWFDVGLTYTHSINNTDTTTFYTSTNGHAVIKKRGTFLIRIHTMMIPTADASGEYACPFINGSVNCGGLSQEAYKHRYAPAGWWASSVHEFIVTLNSNTTVSYGYYPYQALNYWAHDGYTGMEILKLN